MLDCIKSQEEIKEIVENIRRNHPEKKIVTTNGSFDIMHSGHLHSLEKAKEVGDILIVGLNSDKSIQSYKSKNRPIIPEKERAKMLASLKMVDWVVILDEPDISAPLINLIRPDFHVKSRSGYKGFEGPALGKVGGKLILIDDVTGFSTTDIIKKIKNPTVI